MRPNQYGMLQSTLVAMTLLAVPAVGQAQTIVKYNAIVAKPGPAATFTG